MIPVWNRWKYIYQGIQIIYLAQKHLPPLVHSFGIKVKCIFQFYTYEKTIPANDSTTSVLICAISLSHTLDSTSMHNNHLPSIQKYAELFSNVYIYIKLFPMFELM